MNWNPDNFILEKTTLWSFENRGNWATHKGDYRGNWSPYIPRNLISRYTKEGDWILDQFLGSGTTLIESKLLNRNAIGVDINKKAIELSKKRLNFKLDNEAKIFIKNCGAKNLDFIPDSKIDFICSHPPYANVINYSKDLKDDISLLNVEEFIKEMESIANESFRILKNGHMCAIMMGDIRKNSKVIPLGFKTMECYLKSGFLVKEIIIKKQYNCKGTIYWENKNKDFLLLAHEYIFVFQK